MARVVLLEIDGARLAEQLFAAYLKQVLVDGFFHADPHPGNLVALNRDATVEQLEVGKIFLEITRLSAAASSRLPPELSVLGAADAWA